MLKNSVLTNKNALNDSNFKHMLKYSENKNPELKKRKRQRKFFYLNQPFCQSIKKQEKKSWIEVLKTIKYSENCK